MSLHLPSLAELRLKSQQMGANLTQTTLTPNVDDVGKPEHSVPVSHEESYATGYNAYRGTEMHGVKEAAHWDGGPQGFTNGTVDVHWDHSDPDSYVVPVRIVRDADEELRKWRAGQSQAPAAGSNPFQIMNRNKSRTKLTVKNISATSQTLWVGQEAGDTGPFNGYPLSVNESLSLESTGSLFAVSSDANPCPVAFYYEYTQRVTVN